MPLTGRLDAGRRDPLLKMLEDRFAALNLRALPIDRIGVFPQETTASRCRVVDHWELRARDT
jgi:hypothetical protein